MDRNCLRNYDKTRKVHDWFRYFAPVFITFSVALGFITRMLLLFTPPTVIGFTALEWLKIFLLGFVNDVAFSLLALAPAMVVQATLNDAKYKKPLCYIIGAALLAFAVYSLLPLSISFLRVNAISISFFGVFWVFLINECSITILLPFA